MSSVGIPRTCCQYPHTDHGKALPFLWVWGTMVLSLTMLTSSINTHSELHQLLTHSGMLVSALRSHFSLRTPLSDLGWDLSEKLKKWELGFSLFVASCSPGLRFQEAIFILLIIDTIFSFLISQSRSGECLNRRKGCGVLVIEIYQLNNENRVRCNVGDLRGTVHHSPVKYYPRELVTCEWALSPGCGESHLETENHMSCLLSGDGVGFLLLVLRTWMTWLASSCSVNSPGYTLCNMLSNIVGAVPQCSRLHVAHSEQLCFGFLRYMDRARENLNNTQQGRARKRLILICLSLTSQWLETRRSGIHGAS